MLSLWMTKETAQFMYIYDIIYEAQLWLIAENNDIF